MSFISHIMGSVFGPLGLGALFLPKNKSQAATPAIAPPPAPQAAKTADRSQDMAANMAAMGAGGALAGNSSTFLTGPNGVPTSTLDLGKNTLLGQ